MCASSSIVFVILVFGILDLNLAIISLYAYLHIPSRVGLYVSQRFYQFNFVFKVAIYDMLKICCVLKLSVSNLVLKCVLS